MLEAEGPFARLEKFFLRTHWCVSLKRESPEKMTHGFSSRLIGLGRIPTSSIGKAPIPAMKTKNKSRPFVPPCCPSLRPTFLARLPSLCSRPFHPVGQTLLIFPTKRQRFDQLCRLSFQAIVAAVFCLILGSVGDFPNFLPFF